jgi:hypothetical protein
MIQAVISLRKFPFISVPQAFEQLPEHSTWAGLVRPFGLQGSVLDIASSEGP